MTYTLEQALNSSDRHKLFIYQCAKEEVDEICTKLKQKGIPALNVGHQLAYFIESLTDYEFLSIDVQDRLRTFLQSSSITLKSARNPVVVLHNLGILFETALELNSSQLLKDHSKNAVVIILWTLPVLRLDYLGWPASDIETSFDFSETPLKLLNHAI
jgi:hypothetical protein